MPTRGPFPNRADVRIRMNSDDSDPYRDLCSNCDNADACDGGTRPRRPIFFCESFEVFGAAPVMERDQDNPAPLRAAPSANGYAGLCMNCDNVRVCMLPKPEGGVWHCEEYR